jgi:LysM repeat protein
VATAVPTVEPSVPATTYTVKRGDTLSSIAAAYRTSVNKLKKANGLTSSLIRVGQELVIP